MKSIRLTPLTSTATSILSCVTVFKLPRAERRPPPLLADARDGLRGEAKEFAPRDDIRVAAFVSEAVERVAVRLPRPIRNA